MKEICEQLSAQRLPRWDELPDLELYMDQVLSLVERYLSSYPGADGKALTASMVNNYVKKGVMPPPVKKKYTRVHLAHLLMICVLKVVLPIDQIRHLLHESRKDRDEQAVYDDFCETFESSAAEAAEAARNESGVAGIYRSALRAQAERALAIKWYNAVREADQKNA